jgi:hypothetical protein
MRWSSRRLLGKPSVGKPVGRGGDLECRLHLTSVIRKWERLRSGGIRSWPHVHLLGAAFDDGPHLISQRLAVWNAFSHFHRGGFLVMSNEAQFNASHLSPRNRIGHPYGGDVELQLVGAGDEAKLIRRIHRFHGPVHAAREIRRYRWKVRHLVGLGLTNIGQARHAGRKQARQANDSKTFQQHTSMEQVLCLSRCEKNN